MQLVGIILSVSCARSVDGTYCNAQDYSGLKWFNTLVYCSYSSGYDDLLNCLNTAPWGIGSVPEIGPNLITEVSSDSACAKRCIQPFVDTLNALLSVESVNVVCGASWVADSLISINSQACMALMYDVLNTFNSCAANGADIRTGLQSTRCMYNEYIAVLSDFTPYIALLDLAAAQVPINAYRLHVGPGFTSRLNILDCGVCFDSLYESLLDLSSSIETTCSGDDKFSSVCSTDLLGSALSEFSICVGGFTMFTAKPNYCTAEERAVSLDLFRPYRSGVECAPLLNLTNLTPTYDCVGLYNGMMDSPDVPCTICMISTLSSMEVEMTSACEIFGAYSKPCIDSFTAIDGMLANFQLCAGSELSTEDPSCIVSQWGELLEIGAGHFSPFFLAGISSPSFNEAAFVIQNDTYMANISRMITNLPCNNCYNAFAADSWSLWSRNATTRAACEQNIFSDTCFFDAGVQKIRGRFKNCSGHDLLPETYDRCTSDEIANMADLAGELFTIGISTHSPSVVKEFLITSGLATGVISSSCGFCYMYFGTELIKLDEDTKNLCESYYACTLTPSGNMTQIRQGFFTCAGSEIIVSPETSEVISTTPPPYSVVSFIPLYGGNGTSNDIAMLNSMPCILIILICFLYS